ncbi:UbiA family prenyltransferase [Streptomyces sp. NPDC049837]|uniref:UbiA family prenyltransferase n=1 Tax=Streptomyces sp. NPDC049837 TaxID=3155277 RepID=UPI0034156A33
MDVTDRPALAHHGAVGGLLMACHPGPAAAVTVLVTVLAAAAGHDGRTCLLVAAAVLAGQLSVGWSNDAVDAARDRATGRYGKPVVSGSVGEGTVWAAAAVSLGLAVPLSLACGPLAGGVHLAAVAAAWAYNLGAKATVLSWLPYAAAFAAVPAFVTLSLPGSPWPAWWAVAAGALVGVGAHLGNVLPDIGSDLATGVRGWPQRLGPARVRLLLPVPLVAATVVLALAGPPPGGPGAVAPVAVAVAVATAVTGSVMGRRRAGLPFVAAIVVAGVDVAMLVWRGATLT